jgi:hypothetical protein
MSGSPEKSLREIIDAYSPIVRGKKGPLGLLLKAVSRPLEVLRNIVGAVARFPIGFGHENRAGQILTDCPAMVPDTFKRMEKKLQRSFNTASRRDASPIERETFLQLAQSVRADGNALAKHCTILRTEFSSVTEPYNFIVEKSPLGNRAFRTVNLEQGVALVKEQMNSSISDLAADVSAKNPVTIRRKPIELQSRSRAEL